MQERELCVGFFLTEIRLSTMKKHYAHSLPDRPVHDWQLI